MRIVQLRLRPSTMFWNLATISLQRGRVEKSPFINIDNLTDAQKNVINRSISAHEISLYDYEGNRIIGNLNNVNLINGNYVSSEDIEEDKNTIPDVISVTIDNDVEEIVEELEEYSDAYEEAEILLSGHWTTVKKTISSLEKSSKNLKLIHAALELEEENKNRRGVVYALQDALKEQ